MLLDLFAQCSVGTFLNKSHPRNHWWARRGSSVFPTMLIAAAMQAPIRKNADRSPSLDGDGIPLADETESAKSRLGCLLLESPEDGSFKRLKVLDCFMGGGTTLVEGSRLGFQVAGVNLNPVAWFVVKNELACRLQHRKPIGNKRHTSSENRGGALSVLWRFQTQRIAHFDAART